MADIVILGGGFGGAACAREAADLVGPGHRVTVVDRNRVNYLCGANPFVVVGEGGPVSRSLDDLDAAEIGVHVAEVAGIDLSDREVRTASGVLPFDYLVVALGATYDWSAVPGSRDAFGFYDLAGAERLRERLAGFSDGTVAIGVAGAPIKCPPAPFETALLIEWALRARGTPAEIHVAIPEPAPLGIAGPEASARLRAVLDERGVVLHTGAAVTAVDGPRMVLGDGTELAATLPITIPVHRVPEVVAAAGLTNGGGWVPVNRSTLETAHAGVFAIGDVNVIPVGDKAVPKAGVFAAAEGRTVARVIASRILGTEPPGPYDGVGHCFVAFSGSESAQVGGDFFAAGGPVVELEEPSARRHADKRGFEARWRAFAV